MNEALNATAVAEAIAKRLAIKGLQNIKVRFFESTDSTNTRAKEFAKSQTDKAPTVFIALEQTAGHGRMGRTFESPKSKGLYISFLTYPDKSASKAPVLTACAAVKAARAIESLCEITVGIKWVNDLIVNQKKLAGILTEGEYTENGSFSYVICGIGINIKRAALSSSLSQIATSIEEECGIAPNIEELAVQLIEEYFSPASDHELINEYRSRSVLIGEHITVKPILGEPYEAKAIGISDTASLIIETKKETKELNSAEVSIKRHT